MRLAKWPTVTAVRTRTKGHVRPRFATFVAYAQRLDASGQAMALQRPDIMAFAASQHREDPLG